MSTGVGSGGLPNQASTYVL